MIGVDGPVGQGQGDQHDVAAVLAMLSAIRNKAGVPYYTGDYRAPVKPGVLSHVIETFQVERGLVPAKLGPPQPVLSGKAPRAYAYDRAGHSAENVARLRKLGVRDVGLAPRGRTAWAVKGRVKEKLIRERTLVEGSIGTIKGQKYGFNHPAARSAAMMGVCGQRAALGFNLTKLARGIAEQRKVRLAW